MCLVVGVGRGAVTEGTRQGSLERGMNYPGPTPTFLPFLSLSAELMTHDRNKRKPREISNLIASLPLFLELSRSNRGRVQVDLVMNIIWYNIIYLPVLFINIKLKIVYICLQWDWHLKSKWYIDTEDWTKQWICTNWVPHQPKTNQLRNDESVIELYSYNARKFFKLGQPKAATLSLDRCLLRQYNHSRALPMMP